MIVSLAYTEVRTNSDIDVFQKSFWIPSRCGFNIFQKTLLQVCDIRSLALEISRFKFCNDYLKYSIKKDNDKESSP